MTSAQNPRLQEDAAEQLLTALAGIVSAHIVAGDDGRMVEIHILATAELHPKQVVRNVESALVAGLGIQIDRRIVSVAQIRTGTANGSMAEAPPETENSSPAETPPETGNSSPAEAPPETGTSSPAEAPPATGNDSRAEAPPETANSSRAEASPEPPSEPRRGRLEYVRYEARRSETRCTCSVVLREGETEVTGTGDGPDTTGGRAEAAARAVFNAIGHARPELRLKLTGAVISDSRGRRFAIISGHKLLDRTTVPLAGAAVLDRSPEEAAILAALQASNRCSG